LFFEFMKEWKCLVWSFWRKYTAFLVRFLNLFSILSIFWILNKHRKFYSSFREEILIFFCPRFLEYFPFSQLYK
jgi:hypothetical protein